MHQIQKNPILSILVSFKNEEKHLQQCIKSIREQVFQEWELILVDDHSEDASWDIANLQAEQDSRIHTYKNIGKGLIDALETAFNHSSGKFISRMDADDTCTPVKYEMMVNLWQEPGTVVCGQVKYYSAIGVLPGFERYATWLNEVISQKEPWSFIYQECIVPSPAWLVSREDLMKIGGICAGQYPEDYELAFRMYKAQYQIVSTPEVVHLWQDHPARNSRTNPLYANHFFPKVKAQYFSELELQNKFQPVVYGAGKKAKQLVVELQKLDCIPIWLTNNPKKIGHNIYGIILRNSEKYRALPNHKIAVVLAAEEERAEVNTQLVNMGLVKGKQYWFFC
jgi:glycosyltransferase involved in cell wall biosynthesis